MPDMVVLRRLYAATADSFYGTNSTAESAATFSITSQVPFSKYESPVESYELAYPSMCCRLRSRALRRPKFQTFH